MSYNDAITMIQRRRPQAQPIPEFVTMLQQYEITVRSRQITPSTKMTTSTTAHITNEMDTITNPNLNDIDDDDRNNDNVDETLVNASA